MENNPYALEKLVAIKLDEARAEARRLDLLALAPTPPVRLRLGMTLIALGEWLRDTGAVAAARPVVP